MSLIRLNLIKARKAMGYNQKQMAEAMNCRHHTLAQLENGRSRGHTSTWAIISTFTGVDAATLRELVEVPDDAEPDSCRE